MDVHSSDNSSSSLMETVTFVYDDIGDPEVKKQFAKHEVIVVINERQLM